MQTLRFFWSGSLILLVGIALSAAPAAQSDAALVIVGGWDDVPATVGADTPPRYWVVLGAMSAEGTARAPSVAQCAGASVEFTLGPPAAAGFGAAAAASVNASAVTVSMGQLTRWNATASQLSSFRSVAMPRPRAGGMSRYCVATAIPHIADGQSGRTATARIERNAETPASSAAALGYSDPSSRGIAGTYEFQPTVGARRLVIVDRSVGRTYAFAGTQIPGTYAVALGAWDPESERVQPPTARECATAKVHFELFAPEKAGMIAPFDDVGAVWVDRRRATRLFPQTLKQERCAAGRPLPRDNCDRTFRQRPAAMDAARTEAGLAPGHQQPDPLYMCIAEAPVLVADRIGLQRVIAEVTPSEASTDLSIVEGLRQPARLVPGGQAEFKDIRVHAKPRPLLGVLVGTGDITADTSGTGVKSATMAGFDFALDPVLFGRRLPGWAKYTRMVVGTNITGDVGDALYFGLSIPSIAGSLTTTSSPVDLSFGIAVLREDLGIVPSGSVSLDLAGTLESLGKLLGLQ